MSNKSIIPKEHETLLDDLAFALEAIERGAQPTARGGRTGEDQIALLKENPDLYKAAVIRKQELLESGQIARLKAAEVLTDGLQKLADSLDGIHLSALPRVLDIAHKITGWAEERAARLRVADESTPRMSIAILQPGDIDPPSPARNEHQLVIDLRGTAKQDRNRVIDVTPDDAGGKHDD